MRKNYVKYYSKFIILCFSGISVFCSCSDEDNKYEDEKYERLIKKLRIYIENLESRGDGLELKIKSLQKDNYAKKEEIERLYKLLQDVDKYGLNKYLINNEPNTNNSDDVKKIIEQIYSENYKQEDQEDNKYPDQEILKNDDENKNLLTGLNDHSNNIDDFANICTLEENGNNLKGSIVSLENANLQTKNEELHNQIDTKTKKNNHEYNDIENLNNINNPSKIIVNLKTENEELKNTIIELNSFLDDHVKLCHNEVIVCDCFGKLSELLNKFLKKTSKNKNLNNKENYLPKTIGLYSEVLRKIDEISILLNGKNFFALNDILKSFFSKLALSDEQFVSLKFDGQQYFFDDNDQNNNFECNFMVLNIYSRLLLFINEYYTSHISEYKIPVYKLFYILTKMVNSYSLLVGEPESQLLKDFNSENNFIKRLNGDYFKNNIYLSVNSKDFQSLKKIKFSICDSSNFNSKEKFRKNCISNLFLNLNSLCWLNCDMLKIDNDIFKYLKLEKDQNDDLLSIVYSYSTVKQTEIINEYHKIQHRVDDFYDYFNKKQQEFNEISFQN